MIANNTDNATAPISPASADIERAALVSAIRDSVIGLDLDQLKYVSKLINVWKLA